MTMTTSTPPSAETEVIYPESDGQPMADNTKQFRWIVTIQGGIDALFRDNPNVFVAGDLLWYPVEGNNTLRVAPDTMVVFGRPKGDRGSYLQWREDNIAPQVVFEVLSPGNSAKEMLKKLAFYDRYGVEEYYIYDPDDGELLGWQRQGKTLVNIASIIGWVSPRLGIKFTLKNGNLVIYRPDGERFLTYLELEQQRQQERQRAEQERERADKLAERLRSLGVDPDTVI
jgi:Uma2 family endonuclease